jgi:hypothetical protein
VDTLVTERSLDVFNLCTTARLLISLFISTHRPTATTTTMASLLNSFGLGGGSSSSSSTEKKGASFATVFDTTPLPAAVQTHVQSVYALLAMTVAMSAVGAAAHAQYGLGNNPLAQIAVFGLAILIAMTGDPAGVNLVSRASQLGAFGFFQGVCIGPLVALGTSCSAS